MRHASLLLLIFLPLATSASEQSRLDAWLAKATRIEVYADGDEGDRRVFSSADPKDLAALRAAVKLKPVTRNVICACLGNPRIELFAGKRRLGTLGNQHGTSVRFPGVESDVELADQEAWLSWFDARGMPMARAEVNEAAAEAKRNALERAAWRAAMPEALRPLWPDDATDSTPALFAARKAALAEALPDASRRIRALLAWYGAGAGPWSGYPSHEQDAEQLLRDYPGPQLVAALGPDADAAVLLGAARLFGTVPTEATAQLPAPLKKRLLERALQVANEDVKARARRAFETP